MSEDYSRRVIVVTVKKENTSLFLEIKIKLGENYMSSWYAKHLGKLTMVFTRVLLTIRKDKCKAKQSCIYMVCFALIGFVIDICHFVMCHIRWLLRAYHYYGKTWQASHPLFFSLILMLSKWYMIRDLSYWYSRCRCLQVLRRTVVLKISKNSEKNVRDGVAFFKYNCKLQAFNFTNNKFHYKYFRYL